MTHVQRHVLPYALTTADITYHLPDYPDLLQEFIWQDLDLIPDFPVLRKFLKYWTVNLDGRLHSVVVVSSPLVKPVEFKFASAEFHLH